MVFRKISEFFGSGKQRRLEEFKNVLRDVVAKGEISLEDKIMLSEVQKQLRLKDEDIKQASIEIFREAVQNAIADEDISLEEQLRLENLKRTLGLQDEDVKEELETIAEIIVLKDLERGKIPEIPREEVEKYLILEPDEVCHCLVRAALLEAVRRRETGGYYYGLSFRIARGVYFRTGRYTLPKITEEVQKIDEGLLAVTNKRFIFIGDRRSVEIPLRNILSIELFQDSFSVHRKAKKKREYFVVERPKLIAGILHVAAKRALEKSERIHKRISKEE